MSRSIMQAKSRQDQLRALVAQAPRGALRQLEEHKTAVTPEQWEELSRMMGARDGTQG